jgi:hypothetical protein
MTSKQQPTSEETYTGSLPLQTASTDKNPISEELIAIRKDYFELREKIASFQERNISIWDEQEKKFSSLKDRVDDIHIKIKQGIAICVAAASVVTVVVGFFALKFYIDIENVINKTVNSKIDDTIGYSDKLIRNINLINTNSKNCPKVIPQMKELIDKRPDDDIAIFNLLNCFITIENYNEGYEFIEKLKSQKIFPNKLQSVLSFNNSGFIFFIKALEKQDLMPEAYNLFYRAEQIGIAEDTSDIKYPLFNFIYYYVVDGNLGKAAVYVERLREVDATWLNGWEEDIKKDFFKRMQKKRPSMQKDLKNLITKATKK